MSTLLVGVAAMCPQVASADWITWWGDGAPSTHFTVSQQFGTIVILRGDGNTYKFFSETSQGSGVPGVINNITAPNVNGDFTVVIEHSNGTAGALHVQQANLTPTSGTSTFGRVFISGNLGQAGGADIVANKFVSPDSDPTRFGVDIGGDLLNPIDAPWFDSDLRIGGDCAGLNPPHSIRPRIRSAYPVCQVRTCRLPVVAC